MAPPPRRTPGLVSVYRNLRNLLAHAEMRRRCDFSEFSAAAALLAAALLPTPALAREAPSPTRLRADVESLVAFGTRHTLSFATDPKRGIGAARTWAAERFEALSRTCGGCITVERLSRRFTGPRAPGGVVIEAVLGIQRGSDPNRYVIVGAHIDSRVTEVAREN